MKIGNKIDEYEIIEYIGEGGMGTVFRVCKDGNYYALKTCRTDDEESILRFKREVRIMKSVHDSNIIKVIEENLEAIILYKYVKVFNYYIIKRLFIEILNQVMLYCIRELSKLQILG